MALVKTVEMRVLAKAGDAQAKLDEITAQADKLDSDGIRMRFRVDDAEGKAQLDAIKAKADELGFKDISIKVKVDGAGRAIADLLAVKHAEDEVRDAGGGGILGKLGGLIGGGIDAIPGALSGAGGSIPLVGGLAGAGGGAGLAVVVAGAAALVQELVAVGSGFLAAGAGAGAFALLALPAIHKVEEALKASPKKLAKLLPGMDPNELSAFTQIKNMENVFKGMSKAFEPTALKVFADGLKVIGNLLPHLTQFATPFAGAIDGLLQKLAKFTASKGFSDWLKTFSKDVGPAVTAIGTGIGNVVNAFGKLMTTMSGKDIAHAINIAFGGITGTINAVTVSVKFLMQVWDGAGIAIKTGAHSIASAFDTVRHAVATMVSSVAHGVAQVVTFFVTLPGKIVSALGNLGGILVHAGESIMDGLLHGIMAGWNKVAGFVSKIAGMIASLKGPLDYDAVLLVPHGQAIMGGLMRGMDSQMPALRSQLAGITSTISANVSAGGYGRGGAHYEIHLHGVIDKQGAAREIHQMMLEYKRNGGRAALGLA